jgi:hypothetical protein
LAGNLSRRWLFFGPEGNDAERGQGELGRIRFAMAFVLGGDDAAHIADVAAAVNGSVAVDNLAPFAGFWKADAIAKARNRSEVKNHGNGIFAFRILADEREYAGFAVGGVDPLEAL